MNCQEARLLIGADPRAEQPALEEHLRECDACRQFRREMRTLESDLRRVLQGSEPALTATSTGGTIGIRPIHARPRHSGPARFMRPSRWALAASLLALAGAGLLLWALQPSATLADDLVAHVNGEPGSWSSTQPPSATRVQAILRAAGVSLDGSEDVIYARTCPFRGREVPHLVVRTADGPYTVMILPDRSVHHLEHFSEGGYMGELVPARGGTLAILGLKGESTHLERVAAEVSRSVHWRT